MNRRPARGPTRLPQWQEWAVYIGVGVLGATGIAWLSLDWWVRIEGEFGAEHHPAQHWLLVAHGVGAYLFVIVIGAMIPVHMVMGWRTRRNLISGLSLAGFCAALGLSALCLYYVGDELFRGWASTVHWIVGLAFIPMAAIHIIKGLASR